MGKFKFDPANDPIKRANELEKRAQRRAAREAYEEALTGAASRGGRGGAAAPVRGGRGGGGRGGLPAAVGRGRSGAAASAPTAAGATTGLSAKEIAAAARKARYTYPTEAPPIIQGKVVLTPKLNGVFIVPDGVLRGPVWPKRLWISTGDENAEEKTTGEPPKAGTFVRAEYEPNEFGGCVTKVLSYRLEDSEEAVIVALPTITASAFDGGTTNARGGRRWAAIQRRKLPLVSTAPLHVVCPACPKEKPVIAPDDIERQPEALLPFPDAKIYDIPRRAIADGEEEGEGGGGGGGGKKSKQAGRPKPFPMADREKWFERIGMSAPRISGDGDDDDAIALDDEQQREKLFNSVLNLGFTPCNIMAKLLPTPFKLIELTEGFTRKARRFLYPYPADPEANRYDVLIDPFFDVNTQTRIRMYPLCDVAQKQNQPLTMETLAMRLSTGSTLFPPFDGLAHDLFYRDAEEREDGSKPLFARYMRPDDPDRVMMHHNKINWMIATDSGRSQRWLKRHMPAVLDLMNTSLAQSCFLDRPPEDTEFRVLVQVEEERCDVFAWSVMEEKQVGLHFEPWFGELDYFGKKTRSAPESWTRVQWIAASQLSREVSSVMLAGFDHVPDAGFDWAPADDAGATWE